MAKLGYTWYPKDWGNSEHVFELNLSERGLYRELIDLAMLNDNKTEIKIETWCRKFAVSFDDINHIIDKLASLDLIHINDTIIFIPSCENRLKLVRGGANGGKKSKPIVKPNVKGIVKPIVKPFGSLEEKNEKPIAKQREIETKIEKEKKVNIINNVVFSSECMISDQWLEVTAMQNRVSIEIINTYLEHFDSHLITMQEQKNSLKEYKEHFTHWFKKQDLSAFRVKSFGKTNQI